MAALSSPESSRHDGKVEMKDVSAKVVEVIASNLLVDESEVTPGARLVEDLGADSLDIVEIVMALEEEFDIEVPDDEADDAVTVKDVLDYVQKRV